MPAHPGSGPAHVWAEVIGGDALGRGHSRPCAGGCRKGPRCSTPTGCAPTTASTRAGWTAAIQSFVRLPVFDRSRRSAKAQVKVWTDLGESEWSDPVRLEAGLLGDEDWSARWIGVDEDPRPAQGIPAGLLAQDHRGRSASARPGCISPPWACTRRSSTGGASATSNSRPVTPSTARGFSTRRTTSRRSCGRGATCSPSCWPTGGTAARSGCRGRRTSTATTWRCARSSRCRPSGMAGRGGQPSGLARRALPHHRGRSDRRPARGPPAARPSRARPGHRGPAIGDPASGTCVRRPVVAYGGRRVTSTSPSSGRSRLRSGGCSRSGR